MNTYYGTYQQLHTMVKQACDCLASYSSSKFQTEISNIKNEVDNVSVSTWQDSAGEEFRENKENCSKELNNIVSNISSVFKLMESTYIALNSQLENLKLAGDEYDNMYLSKPMQENYQEEEMYEVSEDGTSKFVGYGYGTYDNDLLLWESSIETLNKQCNDCVANVEAYLNILKQIDNNGMEASFIAKCKNIQIPAVYQFKTNNVDKNNNASSSTTTVKGAVLESLGFLSGQELIDFKNRYNIPLDDKIGVERYRATLSGVSFDSYAIFDEDAKDFDKDFKDTMKKSLENLSKVDTAILQKVRNSDYSLLYAETPNCENGSKELGKFRAGALTYSWGDKHIMTFVFDYNLDYSSQTIYHEFGHAYDHVVAGDYVNRSEILTCLNEDGSRQGFRYLSNIPNSVLDNSTNMFDWYDPSVNCDSSVIADAFLKNSDGGVYSWSDLIDLESASFAPGSSVEGFHQSQTEFFASIFGEYYSNPERLKTVAPKCYEAMDKLINIDKGKYMA